MRVVKLYLLKSLCPKIATRLKGLVNVIKQFCFNLINAHICRRSVCLRISLCTKCIRLCINCRYYRLFSSFPCWASYFRLPLVLLLFAKLLCSSAICGLCLALAFLASSWLQMRKKCASIRFIENLRNFKANQI